MPRPAFTLHDMLDVAGALNVGVRDFDIINGFEAQEYAGQGVLLPIGQVARSLATAKGKTAAIDMSEDSLVEMEAACALLRRVYRNERNAKMRGAA